VAESDVLPLEMKRTFALLVFLLCSSLSLAVDASGTWLIKGVDRTVTLQLTITGDAVTGTLEGVQEIMTLEGKLIGSTAEGTVTNSQGSAYFKFDFTTEALTLVLANLDAGGKPDKSSAVTFNLKRPEGPKVEVGFQIAGFAAPSSDPLLGAWVSGTMRLELKNTNGKYSGRIILGKSAFALTATGNASSLKGTFKQGKTVKTFTAKFANDQLTMTLDGKKYVLAKVR
jgi:hypothetical protein